MQEWSLEQATLLMPQAADATAITHYLLCLEMGWPSLVSAL